eukprot:2484220-Prymnesium_polylepis.1
MQHGCTALGGPCGGGGEDRPWSEPGIARGGASHAVAPSASLATRWRPLPRCHARSTGRSHTPSFLKSRVRCPPADHSRRECPHSGRTVSSSHA